MSEQPHSSMKLLRLMGQKLVNRETAVEFAKSMLREVYGDKELQLQSPLSIQEFEATWQVVGCKRKNVGAGIPANDVRESDVCIVISKFDGQILKLTFEGGLTPLDRDGEPFSE